MGEVNEGSDRYQGVPIRRKSCRKGKLKSKPLQKETVLSASWACEETQTGDIVKK